MNHANEQILLFCIGEEFDIPLTAMVADHCKASYGVFRSVIVQNLSKSPVHLVSFSRLGGEPTAPVTLRCYELAFGGNKEPMSSDIILDSTQTTRKTGFLQPLQTNLSVGYTLNKDYPG